jgi:hypothetical protein
LSSKSLCCDFAWFRHRGDALAIRIIAVLAAIFSLAMPAFGIPPLVGSEVELDRLYLIDPNTAARTPIGPLSDGVVASLTYDPRNSILYGSTTLTRQLLRINPETAEVSVVGPLNVRLMHGIEYDVNRRLLYGISQATQLLYTIDVNTGAATPIGPTGFDGIRLAVSSLAYDAANDVMYAVDGGLPGSSRLFTIDVSTGFASIVGPLNHGELDRINGLAFHPAIGLIAADNSGSADLLFRIDTATGQATLIGDLSYGNFLGLAFLVPEPCSLTAASIGLVCVLTCRRRPLNFCF